VRIVIALSFLFVLSLPSLPLPPLSLSTLPLSPFDNIGTVN